MHPDNRRRGRRIRKQRRVFRRVGEQFGYVGKAAGVAATAFGSLASAIRTAVAREEELARAAAEGTGQPTNREIIRCDYCDDALPSVPSRARIPTTPDLQRLGFDASKVVCPECVAASPTREEPDNA